MAEHRYSRLARYAGFHATLPVWQAASCAIVGLGGLGGGLATQLARLGVADLWLIDRDVVSESNLGHQQLYTTEQARQAVPKVQAAAQWLAEVNPAVKLHPCNAGLTYLSARELLGQAKLLFDGLDNYYSRLLLNDWALSSHTPYFYAGVVRGELSVKAIIPGQTSCLRCLIDHPPAPGEVETCASGGLFPPLLGIANALQIDLANRWLAGEFSAADDVLYSLRLPDWQFRQVHVPRRPDCPACQGRYEFLDGILDPYAVSDCSGEIAIQLKATPLEEMQALIDRLNRYRTRCHPHHLVAEAPDHQLIVYPSGWVVLRGSNDRNILARLMSEAMGL
ncbi:ThiF family adenylyltransferase [bacterium]|nr:ThiF family adenylyltransferase [bacterium]